MIYYRMMLVDDEEEVRKGIINKIDWEGAGFQLVGDAENGEEALEMIEQLKPDVVMTDIRMPYMDGLALTVKIRKKYPSMKVLIFSGFDDFEYAQQAIKLDVTEYILKPVNVEELTEILNRVKQNLDEEIEQRRNVTLLRDRYQKNLPIIRDMFLSDLIMGNSREDLIEVHLKEYEVDILEAKRWAAAVIDIETSMGCEGKELSLHHEKELIPLSVKQLAEDHLKPYYRCTIFETYSGPVLIAAIDQGKTLANFIDLLGDVCKECKRILEVSVTIGVGRSCACLTNISKSYDSAVDALGYKALVAAGQTIYINDVEPVDRGTLLFDSRDEAELIAAVKFGPEGKIEETLQSIDKKMTDARVHTSQCQAYMLSVFNCLARLTQQYDLYLPDMSEDGQDYINLISKIQKPEDFFSWTLKATLRMHEIMKLNRENTTKQIILKAQRYIEEHYHNPDLSVEMICQHLHLSPAYFSTMFKKETGQSYITYLTETRMSKAVELLKETDEKTYVIAASVGYQEQNYFSYVFKKRFGVSPTKFRGA